MKLLNKLGRNSGSPCKTARFLENSLKLPGRFRLKRGTNDINWMQPKSNQVASTVPPKTTEMKILEPKVSSKVSRLALDWVLAVAFSSSEITAKKNGTLLEATWVLKLFPSTSVKIEGFLNFMEINSIND